ncbi:MAG: hypothetical protein AAF730_20135 [Bacteroidota bacterium]
MSLRFLLSAILIALISTASPAQAQDHADQFSDYVEAATYAADQGKTLLVYFYSTERGQPAQLRDWLTDEAAADGSYQRFAVVGVDVDGETGRALAEALYGRTRFSGMDKDQAALVVEHSPQRRGMTFLSASQGTLDVATWRAFVSNAEQRGS